MITVREIFETYYPKQMCLYRDIRSCLGKEVDWSDLSKIKLYKIREYLSNKYSINSVSFKMAIIKALMNKMSQEIEIDMDSLRDVFKIKKEGTISVYLTEQEIGMLERYEPKGETEDYVKTITIIQLFTGARFSDAITLTEENIIGEELVYISQKTHKEIRVPLKKGLNIYLKRLQVLPTFSSVTFWKVLKVMCSNAGICNKVRVYRGGKYDTKPKYQFISSHTARRSFATNLLLRGVDIYTISRLMGHSDIKMTAKYICANPLVKNEAMDYFK